MYNSLYWTDELDYDFVKRTFRIFGEGYTSAKIVDAWAKKGNHYGIPRQWAKDRRMPGADKTILAPVKWPKFKASYKYNQKECCDVIEQALLNKYGALLESPTGWGKTVAALEIASRMGQRTLVLVHKQDLIKQWAKAAKDFFGLSCGRIQQDKWDFDHNVSVGMVQTLKSRELSEDFVNSFGMIIVDEGHRTPCDTICSVIAELPARYRLGVSATWRRPDKLDNLWHWHIGNIEAKGKRPKLPAVYFQIGVDCDMSDVQYTRSERINHSAMVTAIAQNRTYNDQVIVEIREAMKSGRNILVVSHRIEQLEYFFKKIPGSGMYVGSLKGNTLSGEALEQAAKKQVVLATFKKVEEGTDIPRLDTLLLATPCTDPEQVIGRVARDYPDKKKIVIVDFIAKTGYNYALANKRKKRYEILGISKGE